MKKNFYFTLLIVLIGISSCTHPEIECSYVFNDNYKLIVSNVLKDVGINDYNCARKVKVVDNKTDRYLIFDLPESFRCDFFTKKITYESIDFMFFYNIDNPLVTIVNLTDMEVLSKNKTSSYLENQCNCNNSNCRDSSNCEKFSICKYD